MVDWTSIQGPSLGAAATPQDPQLNLPGNTTTATPTAANGGPPYVPNTALVGGVPTPSIDDPISAVLTFLFLVSAAAHMAVFQVQKKRGHLFVFSAMMFAFSLIRALALILRMAWASFPLNARLSIAANVLAQAGTILVFLINLFFAQRILRAYHPNVGWSTPTRIVFRFMLASVVLSLLMVIISTVQSFFTLNEASREADHKVQLFGGTYLTVLAFMPIPIVILAATIPRKYVTETFGAGSWNAKLFLLLFTSVLMTIGAGFRAGTNYSPRPRNDPAWYHGRGPYYSFNYILDVIVAYLYLASGFHKRFHIPDGAKGPGSYMGGLPTEKARVPGHKSRSMPEVSFQSSETLTQFGSNPSSKLKGGKMPIGHVGYNDSVSSLKAQQKQQQKRLSKTHPKPFKHSNGSGASQSTYVGSTAPSVAETAGRSNPSLYRGAAGDRGSGMTLKYSDNPLGNMDPPATPPVPAVPAGIEGAAYGHGMSQEGTIFEEQGDHAAAARSNQGRRSRRQSDVINNMLGKMGNISDSTEGSERPLSGRGNNRRSVERVGNVPRSRDSRDYEMSGAAGVYHPQWQTQGAIEVYHPTRHADGSPAEVYRPQRQTEATHENPEDRSHSSASSRYTDA